MFIPRLGQRVRATSSASANCIGKTGTVICANGPLYTMCVEFDEEIIGGHTGNNWRFKGRDEHCWWLSLENLEALDEPDVPVDKPRDALSIDPLKQFISELVQEAPVDKKENSIRLPKNDWLPFEELGTVSYFLENQRTTANAPLCFEYDSRGEVGARTHFNDALGAPLFVGDVVSVFAIKSTRKKKRGQYKCLGLAFILADYDPALVDGLAQHTSFLAGADPDKIAVVRIKPFAQVQKGETYDGYSIN